jgi:flavin-binding protein dodecin
MSMKRAAKVRPVRARAGSMTGRDGAIDFAARSVMLSQREVASPDDHVYRVIEIVGTSEDSIEEAISSAVARADKTLRNLRWFEVVRTSGHIANGVVEHYQVTLKVGFTMEGPH